MSQYIFDNARPQAARRFASLEALYDPWTIQHLERTGVAAGWSCLEVGGGGGSIAAWLADRVGERGHVLVTDIDPRFLSDVERLSRANVEVRRHDVCVDPLPEGAFDLIHGRLVVAHVPEPQEALRKLAAALKPDGWLVVEDFAGVLKDRTFVTADAEAGALHDRVLRALGQLREARAGDRDIGRTYYLSLKALGLTNVGMEGYLAVWPGQSIGAQLQAANLEQVREEAIARGVATHDDLARVLQLLADPSYATSSPVMLTAWGQRPG